MFIMSTKSNTHSNTHSHAGNVYREGQFRKGASGNPAGRPKGIVNKYALLAKELMGVNSEAIVGVIIDKALKGDVNCLKMCIDRIIPTTKYAGTSLKDNTDETPKIVININGNAGSLPEILEDNGVSGVGEDVTFEDEDAVVATIERTL